jgi:hypothetical protein
MSADSASSPQVRVAEFGISDSVFQFRAVPRDLEFQAKEF